MSLLAVPPATFERERARALVPVKIPISEHDVHLEGHSDRCGADWRRPDGYWACVRRAGHRGRHRMRSNPHAA